MSETQVTPWDQIDVDEEISEADQMAAESVGQERLPGKFLCEVIESNCVTKEFKNYSCYAAALKMKVLKIIKISQVVMGEDGKPIVREGKAIQTVRPVPESKKTEFDALYVGSIISDEINLFNPKEKPAMKNRRVFVAKKLKILNDHSNQLKTEMWGGVVGRTVIVETEYNSWTDKETKEVKRNVKVGWSGYDFASNDTVSGSSDVDTEEFDI